MLQSFGPEIWIADGPVVSFFGFAYPTRMAVIRLRDGSLFVWSPIALDAVLKQETERLGKVAHLISPNKLHHLYLGEWRAAFPEARLYASPGLARRRRDLNFTAELDEVPEPAWAEEIDQLVLPGSIAMTEMIFLHRASRTALFCDSLQNFAPDWFKGWRGWLARLDGIVCPHHGMPREWRATFWRRRKARRVIERVIAFAPERVFFPHGLLPETDGAGFVRNGFRWLLK